MFDPTPHVPKDYSNLRYTRSHFRYRYTSVPIMNTSIKKKEESLSFSSDIVEEKTLHIVSDARSTINMGTIAFENEIRDPRKKANTISRVY